MEETMREENGLGCEGMVRSPGSLPSRLYTRRLLQYLWDFAIFPHRGARGGVRVRDSALSDTRRDCVNSFPNWDVYIFRPSARSMDFPLLFLSLDMAGSHVVGCLSSLVNHFWAVG